MLTFNRRGSKPIFDKAFTLACIFMFALWLAGGASRADASGQVIVRSVAWGIAILIVLFAKRPSMRFMRPVALILCGMLALALIQLLPLPPQIWQSLPGRNFLIDAAAGQAQPWRPWSMVPGATANAASSLIVPIVTLLIVAGMGQLGRDRLPGLLLSTVFASSIMGLLQFSGAGFDNPFINDTAGQVSGSFANRNHFALFLAIGCLLAPVWAFRQKDGIRWRGPIAVGLVLLFILTILASGSRVGMVVGGLGLGLGLVIVRQDVVRALRGYPRWVLPAISFGSILVFGGVVLASIATNRAISINRMLVIDPSQDMRQRGFSTVIEMVRTYFPFGSGLGSFDPIFRMHEPFKLLKFTYFNHAHNDFIEIILDTGIAGAALLLAALLWWAVVSLQSWRSTRIQAETLPRLGSSVVLLVLVASAFDYPARTPTIMAVLVVAGIWLSSGYLDPAGSALPGEREHL